MPTHYATRLVRVVHGRSAIDALRDVLREDGLRRVFVVGSAAVCRTPWFDLLRAGLGDAACGVHAGMRPHTPRDCVLAAVEQADTAKPDAILAVGGGSAIDGGKAVAHALWRGARTAADLDAMKRPARRVLSSEPEPSPRLIAIPTTFSAAEFSPHYGMLDQVRCVKDVYGHEYAVPRTVILDPVATAGVPLRTLLATGVKALDHAVETLCAREPHPFVDPLAARAIRDLSSALQQIARGGDTLDARQLAQIAMWMSVAGPLHGVMVGASHALGHALGAECGLDHGITSCITLSAVLRWNATVNAARQDEVCAALGLGTGSAADGVRELVRSLGLPLRLEEVGVGHEAFERVAQLALHDRYMAFNPRPARGVADVLEILSLAA
jgi:maleylacetate reductase